MLSYINVPHEQLSEILKQLTAQKGPGSDWVNWEAKKRK